jgi:hypothetical protein
VGIGVRIVQQQNLLAAVLDEINPIIHVDSEWFPLCCSVSPVVKDSFTTGDTEYHRRDLP